MNVGRGCTEVSVEYSLSLIKKPSLGQSVARLLMRGPVYYSAPTWDTLMGSTPQDTPWETPWDTPYGVPHVWGYGEYN